MRCWVDNGVWLEALRMALQDIVEKYRPDFELASTTLLPETPTISIYTEEEPARIVG